MPHALPEAAFLARPGPAGAAPGSAGGDPVLGPAGDSDGGLLVRRPAAPGSVRGLVRPDLLQQPDPGARQRHARDSRGPDRTPDPPAPGGVDGPGPPRQARAWPQ